MSNMQEIDSGTVAGIIGSGIGLILGTLTALGTFPFLPAFIVGAGAAMLASGLFGLWVNDFRRDGLAGDLTKHMAAGLFGFGSGFFFGSAGTSIGLDVATFFGLDVATFSTAHLDKIATLGTMAGVSAVLSGIFGAAAPNRTVYSPNYDKDNRCESFRPRRDWGKSALLNC